MIINSVETKIIQTEALANVGSKKSDSSSKQEVSEKIGKAKELLLSQRVVENDVFCKTAPKPEPKPETDPWTEAYCGTVPKPDPEPDPWPLTEPDWCGTKPPEKLEPDPWPPTEPEY